ncbi:MAG: GDP-mannose 4,6-dehydratase, partial [Chloroflexi bacterium]|nr:GDP-mannose 4,6-dehydratase [Chloroflexota bacterium]
FMGQALRGEPLTVYGDGGQTRSFCYVDDLVEGIVRLLGSDEHEPVNLGNPEEISILDFAHRINQITGNAGGVAFKELRTEGDPQRRQPDISKAQRALGWEPVVSLEQGLERTIKYFRGKVGR